jgi:hypothetical protein
MSRIPNTGFFLYRTALFHFFVGHTVTSSEYSRSFVHLLNAFLHGQRFLTLCFQILPQDGVGPCVPSALCAGPLCRENAQANPMNSTLVSINFTVNAASVNIKKAIFFSDFFKLCFLWSRY